MHCKFIADNRSDKRLSFLHHRLPFKRRHSFYVVNILGSLIVFLTLSSHAATPSESNLANLTFEELANIQITSVSKKAERLADAAASVFVITAEEIRRTGATSVPEALRLAPNLQVAQVNASGYAISARGFNGSNSSASNKLLVMIDGRSVYTPLFSGVFWDVQDVMMEDIDRIEVISGPGSTLWGVNAVNGVINIITRSAKDTQGTVLAAGAGSQESKLALRYGGAAGEDGAYRVYGKHSNQRRTSTQSGSAVNDAYDKSQVGFRIDWGHANNKFNIIGNAYSGSEEQPAPGSISISGINLPLGTISVSGANLTTRWDSMFEGGSNLSFQTYYDHTERVLPPFANETLDIIDMQLQHSLPSSGMHALIWGMNYRYGMDRVVNRTPFLAFLPANVNQKWGSLFLQDEITLHENVRLTLGTRLEHNDYTGKEFLPSARLAWNLAPAHMLWTAASRTVRSPSRFDRDVYIPGSPPFLLDGGAPVRSEVANVYELGYRGQPASNLTYSVTAFHTVYDHLRTQEIAPSGTYLVFGSEMEGKATGIEMWGTYQALPSWRLSAGFTALKEKLRLKPNSNDLAAPTATGNDPSNTWQLRSAWNLDADREFDATVRHVSALAKNNVPAYTALDVRYAWKLRRDLELSITGKNLTGGHVEYGPLITSSEISPSVFFKLLWTN
jgi:iron complex outermembrane receptor protein